MSRTAPAPRRAARRARTAAALVLVAALAGCGSQVGGGFTDDGERAGYVSADTSVTTWPVGEREGPVTVSGLDFDGEAVDTADWAGDVVVLNTWYAACPPCRAEAPDLVAVAEEYADDGVHLLGINSTDDAGAALAFERTFEVPYPSLHDADGAAVAALQGVVVLNAVPTTVVLDREGMVAARVLGKVEGSTLRGLVDDVLAEGEGA
ncbi:TlpA family protein disulfide reductase [Cellulomonas sp. APG4]|uniref:TlpA family protein disulfide reductase n=1 Tax=Cellulomonas sp. APG4 TaxID=1538656 RepID=UPI00137A1143|nr:TlpA disulfide reductase family protein [Cellulomonas sp. APG4]NCT91650.1 TlpA family protein disulfide reductase [Cellulomonas sp. APG4]